MNDGPPDAVHVGNLLARRMHTDDKAVLMAEDKQPDADADYNED